MKVIPIYISTTDYNIYRKKNWIIKRYTDYCQSFDWKKWEINGYASPIIPIIHIFNWYYSNKSEQSETKVVSCACFLSGSSVIV